MKINFREKIPKVRFYGFNEDKKYQDSLNDVIVSKRIIGLIGLTLCFILILFCRLIYIEVFESSYLEVKLDKYGTTTYNLDSPRGEIVDRNYTQLVSNNNIVCITYFAPKSITTSEIENIAKFLSTHVNVNIEEITLRNKKDYFITAHKDLVAKLVSDKEKKELSGLSNYSKKLYDLQLERITEEMINQKMTQDDIEYYRFLYLMKTCTSGSVVLAENLTIDEASLIGQNSNALKGIKVTSDWTRAYNTNGQFTQVLGKVSTKKQGLPSELKDVLLALDYNNNSRVGTTGLENEYENTLRGKDSTYTLQYDKEGYPSVNVKSQGESGDNIRLSLDWELQQFADQLIENELKAVNSRNKYFEKMFFMMMDPDNGQILVMSGKKIDKNTGVVSDYAAGNYLEANKIGSTIKGATLYTGFKNNVITPNTYFVDEPLYFKGSKAKKSWKTMGNINEIDALAYSSNVYMFRVGMKLAGAQYVPHGTLNINKDAFKLLRNSLGELGLGVKTGVDIPNEALGYVGSNPLSGNFLDACIGQYDTYTNMQLMQYTCTLANQGQRIQPTLMLDTYRKNTDGSKTELQASKTTVLDDVSNESVAFQQIQQGMRACVTRNDGTCHSFWSTKPYTTYAKTGTAEDYGGGDGKTDYPNHLQIGYITANGSDKPVMAFAAVCVRETVGTAGSSSAPLISSQVMDKYVQKYGLN